MILYSWWQWERILNDVRNIPYLKRNLVSLWMMQETRGSYNAQNGELKGVIGDHERRKCDGTYVLQG
jgi:hypothetical protein